MVLQVFANPRQIDQGPDAVLLQQSGWAYARELQNLRRANRACGQHHRLGRMRGHHVLAVPHLDTGAALLAVGQGLHQQFGHLRRGPHLEIGSSITSGAQKRFGGIPAPAVFLVHLEIAHALVGAAVEVVVGGDTRLNRRLGKGIEHVPAQALFVHPPFATRAMQRVATFVMVFMALEIRQGIVPAPTRVTRHLGPQVVVARLAAHVNHAVDARAPAQYLASWVAQAATIQARSRFGLVEPIGARVANAIQIAHGDVHPVVIVFAPRFDQQHPLAAIGTQAVGKQAACGARANDDVVKGGVAHFDVGITNSAPLPMLSGQRCMMDFCLV